MADRYGVPVPVLKRMGYTMRDIMEFCEWERENPPASWWTEQAARAQGVKFSRTPKVVEGQDDDLFLRLAKGAS